MRLTSAKLNASLTLTQCLNIILQKYASSKDVIALTTDRTIMNFKVLRLDIRRGRILNDFLTHFPDFYVIEISSDAELWAFWFEIAEYHDSLRNTRAKFLFIGKDFSPLYYNITIFNYLINSIFMNTDTRILYRIDLYVHGKFRTNGSKFVSLGKCDTEFQEYKTFYYSNVPKKGEKHEITVAYFAPANNIYRFYVNYKRPGLEVEIIHSILEHLNINHSFVSKDSSDLEKFIWFEDLLICGCQIFDYLSDEQTAAYHYKYMKWMVPVPEKIERWRYILLVFSPICWILFLTGLSSILIVLYLLKYTYLYSDEYDIQQVVFLIFLGRTKQFRTRYISLDILIFCMVFWSVMMNYLFSSKLTYLLNGITYEKGIETIEDIAKNHLFVITHNGHYEAMVKGLPEFSNYPQYLFQPLPRPGRYWGNVPEHENMALILSSDTLRLQKKYFTNKKSGLMFLKELEPPFLTKYIGAIFKRGHPLFDHFNRHVQYFIESGLSKKIVKYYEAPKWEPPTVELTQKLKLEHIHAPLMVLAVGLMLSLFAFFFELKDWKYTTKNIR